MSFQAPSFFVFFPCVFFLFYIVRERYRWIVLLVASFVFYAWLKAPYLLLALALIIINTYYSGIWINKFETKSKKKAVFWFGMGVDLLVLIYLKYLPFSVTNINLLIKYILPTSPILPVGQALISIGVSFYVFQAFSYLIDIYHKTQEPERHLGYLALSLSFFPKLLQGPIERTGTLLPQLRKKYTFSYDNMKAGLLMFALGMFKKVVIADRLALFVNPVYGDVHSYHGISLIMATYYYAFQIYYDFSGYTDMALGIARMFNIELTNNFNYPYLANSVADFWRRWHISLSTWFRYYLFSPLSRSFLSKWGATCKNIAQYLATLITMALVGLWHGASWVFFIWGLLHGIYLTFSIFSQPLLKKIYKKLGLEETRIFAKWKRVTTFHLVCFAWIFFRSNSISDALYVVTHLLNGIPDFFKGIFIHISSISQLKNLASPILIGQDIKAFLLLLVSMGFVEILQIIQQHGNANHRFSQLPTWCRWGIYYVIVIFILCFGIFGSSKFIYFQF